ncbi:MAG: hypothetical protein Q4A97_11390, partial [Comamonadaceae bacterium]|nr:hypothetical protein [Comamonadaceae bacterium]
MKACRCNMGVSSKCRKCKKCKKRASGPGEGKAAITHDLPQVLPFLIRLHGFARSARAAGAWPGGNALSTLCQIGRAFRACSAHLERVMHFSPPALAPKPCMRRVGPLAKAASLGGARRLAITR